MRSQAAHTASAASFSYYLCAAKRRRLLAPSCKGHAQAKTNKIKVQIEDLLRFDCTMRDHCPMRSHAC